MNELNFTEERLREARQYALCIVFKVNSFVEFAYDMMDYMGDDICPLCKVLYKECYNAAFEKGFHLDDEKEVDRISDEELRNRFKKIKENEKQREEEEQRKAKELFGGSIDELQFLTKEYRKTEEFQKMIDFVGKFHYFAPYNAMLLEAQKPGSTLVLNGAQWRKYGRRIKPNAQRLVTLVPFGPVQFVFDYSDTEPIEGEEVTEEAKLMEMYDALLQNPDGKVDKDMMERLIGNLPSCGIYYDDSFIASNTYGGYLAYYKKKIKVGVLKRSSIINADSMFILSVNHNMTDAEKFHTICHELGHLFCRHLYYDRDKVRRLSNKEEEFEAETVAWLVCKRHGINNPSEKYLATYATYDEIPLCSPDLIMKAAAEIEKMLNSNIYVKPDSPWCHADKEFKQIVDLIVSENRRQTGRRRVVQPAK